MMEVVDARTLVVLAFLSLNACKREPVSQDTASVGADTNAPTPPAVSSLRVPDPPKAESSGSPRFPTAQDWNAVRGEVVVRGSSALGCETKMLREWLRVSCGGEGDGRGSPKGVAITKEGGGGTARTFLEAGRMGLVMRYERGTNLEALFSWATQSHKFRASWPAGQRTEPQVKAVFEGVGSPLDVAAIGEDTSCRKNPHCGPDLECCFDPTSDTATCAKECAEISLVACVTKADCDPGLRCTDIGYDVNICAP